MANDFSKEERVAFEEILLGFEDALVLSRNVDLYRADQRMMERANDEIWRPMPYIAQAFTGTDMTANFYDSTQISVPVYIDTNKAVPWKMTARQLRDDLQEGRLGEAAYQRLASEVNSAIMTEAVNLGSLVVKVTAAASGFDDMAIAEAVMNEIGVAQYDRRAAIATRDYNSMAGDLAGRDWTQGKVLTAYEQARVGIIASFDTYKLDYANRLTAATATGVTINGANQYYTPVGYDSANSKNVDNRYQTIAVTVGANTIAVGDCFTVAGVNSVHLISKQDTGQLKTFRVVELVTGAGGTGTIKITPPMISGGGATAAELMYQNVSATPANGAAITFLNTVTAYANPFWQKSALEIIPGRNAIPTNAGVAVLRGTTDQGLEVQMQKWYDIKTMEIYFRVDCLFGVAVKNTEFAGIMLFNQT